MSHQSINRQRTRTIFKIKKNKLYFLERIDADRRGHGQQLTTLGRQKVWASPSACQLRNISGRPKRSLYPVSPIPLNGAITRRTSAKSITIYTHCKNSFQTTHSPESLHPGSTPEPAKILKEKNKLSMRPRTQNNMPKPKA